MNDMINLVIRSFNNEADYCVDNVILDNIDLGEKRIRQSFDTCNRLGRVMGSMAFPVETDAVITAPSVRMHEPAGA